MCSHNFFRVLHLNQIGLVEIAFGQLNQLADDHQTHGHAGDVAHAIHPAHGYLGNCGAGAGVDAVLLEGAVKHQTAATEHEHVGHGKGHFFAAQTELAHDRVQPQVTVFTHRDDGAQESNPDE